MCNVYRGVALHFIFLYPNVIINSMQIVINGQGGITTQPDFPALGDILAPA